MWTIIYISIIMALLINYRYKICLRNIIFVTYMLHESINFNNRHWKCISSKPNSSLLNFITD